MFNNLLQLHFISVLMFTSILKCMSVNLNKHYRCWWTQHYIQQKIADMFKQCVNVHWYLNVHVCKSEQALEMLVDMSLYSMTDYRCISSLCLYSIVYYSACL